MFVCCYRQLLYRYILLLLSDGKTCKLIKICAPYAGHCVTPQYKGTLQCVVVVAVVQYKYVLGPFRVGTSLVRRGHVTHVCVHVRTRTHVCLPARSSQADRAESFGGCLSPFVRTGRSVGTMEILREGNNRLGKRREIPLINRANSGPNFRNQIPLVWSALRLRSTEIRFLTTFFVLPVDVSLKNIVCDLTAPDLQSISELVCTYFPSLTDGKDSAARTILRSPEKRTERREGY